MRPGIVLHTEFLGKDDNFLMGAYVCLKFLLLVVPSHMCKAPMLRALVHVEPRTHVTTGHVSIVARSISDELGPRTH